MATVVLPFSAILVGLLVSAAARYVGGRLPAILDGGARYLWDRGADGAAAVTADNDLREASLVHDVGLAGVLLVFSIVAGPERGPVVVFLGGGLLLAAAIDLRHRILPDLITLPLMCCGLAAALAGLGPVDPMESVLGGGVGCLLAVSLMGGAALRGRRAGVGGGDVKLVIALGTWLGPVGTALTLLVACLGHAAVVLGLRIRQVPGVEKGQALPFGPALALAALVVLSGALDRWLPALFL